MTKFLDTNILVRFIVGDVEQHVKFVYDLFEEANINYLTYFISPAVLIELRYVLSSFYKLDKDDICEALEGILSLGFIQIFDNSRLDFNQVLEIFKTSDNLSFEDSLYLQTCLQNDLELVTFDQKLGKVYKDLTN